MPGLFPGAIIWLGLGLVLKERTKFRFKPTRKKKEKKKNNQIKIILFKKLNYFIFLKTDNRIANLNSYFSGCANFVYNNSLTYITISKCGVN